MAAREIASLIATVGVDDRDFHRGMAGVDSRIDSTGGKFKNLSAGVGDFGKKMAGLGAATVPLTAALGVTVKAAIDWESQFAGVVKTVDATDKELGILEDTLRDMATGDSPVSALEGGQATLAGIAEAAGQLGVEIDAIDEFTETVAMLGTATNLTGEEAATFAARFANVTGLNIAEDIDNLGDTIVTLGNNLATTESEIATFGQRLSPLATFGWDPQDILAYGGALSSLGVSAELGGTNVLKTISDMTVAVAEGGDELTGFAGVAGLTADEFAKLNKNDPEGSFNAFIKGLAGLSADEQILALQGLNITGTEQISVLQRLAAGYDTLDESLELANEGWDENGALAKEAAARAKTLQGRLNKLGNTTTELQISVGEHLTPAVGDFVDGLTPVVKGVSDWIQENPELAGTVIRVAGAIGVAGTALLGIGGAIAIASPAIAGLAIGIGLLISPLGLAVAGLAALVAFGPQIAETIGNVDFAGLGQKLRDAISGIQIGDTTVGAIAADIKTKITDAINGITIDTSGLTALPGQIETAVTGAVNSVTIDTSGITGVVDQIEGAITGGFMGEIDLTGVNTWADANMNAILDTVVTVAGMVLGGPIGLAIGAAKLISSAIESDFLGIGTFLSESGISAAVEGAFNDLKATIDGIIASIFGGGGEQSVSMSDHVRSMVDTGGGAGVLGKFGADLAKGVEVIKGIVESVGPGITEGIEALGAGVGRFIAGITGAETEGLYDAIRPVLGVIGGLVTAGITLAGLGIGTALETFGNVLGPLGEGIGGLITAVSRLGEGDISGALEALGGGIKKFGDAALAIPATIANNVLGAIEGLIGVELPDFPATVDEWASAIGNAFRGVGIIFDNIKRGLDLFFLDVQMRITGKIGELRQTILDMTEGSIVGAIDIAPAVNEANVGAQSAIAGMKYADALTAALNAQLATGEGIDLGQAITVDTGTGFVKVNTALTGFLSDPTVIAGMGEAGKLAIEQALAVAFATADTAAIDTLVPVAIQLGIDTAAIQTQVAQDVTAAAESATPSANVAVNVNAAVANLGAVVGNVMAQIQSALGGTALGQAANAVGNAISNIGASVAPPLATGTPMVYQDGLAYLHKGEAVLTAEQNSDRMRGGRAGGGNTTYVINQPFGNGYQIVDQLRRVENNGPRRR